jgi:hypothetical protein
VNILLLALGSHGDVHPFVGIGRALRERGHDVTVAANEYFKPMVEKAGLEFIAIGTAEEYREMATDPALWHRFTGPQAVFNATAKYLPTIHDIAADFARRPNAIIAASTLAFGARVAQDHLHFPMASVHLSPAVFQSAQVRPNFIPFSFFPRWLPRVTWRVLWAGLNEFMDRMAAPTIN